MGPFTKFHLTKVTYEQHSPGDSKIDSRTRIMSEEFFCYNLSPEGQAYKDVISPFSNHGEKTIPFFLEMYSFVDNWKYPTRLNIKLSRVKVLMLYRWVNELMQYMLNPEILMGRFISNYFPEAFDMYGNPPPPMLWSVLLKSSMVLMPRNSCCKDLIALNADDLYVFKSFEWESFKVPTGKENGSEVDPEMTYERKHSGDSPEEKRLPPRRRGSSFSAEERIGTDESVIHNLSPHKMPHHHHHIDDQSAGSADISRQNGDSDDDGDVFLETSHDLSAAAEDLSEDSSTYSDFEDADEENRMEEASFTTAYFNHDADSSIDSEEGGNSVGGSTPVSSFNAKSLIPRITVQAKDLRILSSLGNTLEEGEASYATLSYCLSSAEMNPIEDGALTYVPKERSGIEEDPFKNFVWKEITPKSNPLELEVVIDYDPHKRIMISDFITNVNKPPSAQTVPPPFALSVSQAQFYLLLSIWYSNMQELPIMFPFNEKELREFSVFPEVPKNWPEYGTDPWIKHVTRQVDELNFEFLIRFKDVSLDCSFDETYFETTADCLFMCRGETKKMKGVGFVGEAFKKKESTNPSLGGIKLRFEDLLLFVDSNPEGLLKVAAGAKIFELTDERKPGKSFNKTAFRCAKASLDEENLLRKRSHKNNTSSASATRISSAGTSKPTFGHGESFSSVIAMNTDFKGTFDPIFEEESKSPHSFDSFVDKVWGLSCGRHTLLNKLPQPFNLTVYMTPDMFCHVNVGLDHVDGATKDLAPIWMALDFFGNFWQKPEFGMPYFACESARNTAMKIAKSVLSKVKADIFGNQYNKLVRDSDEDCQNLDIRLWMNRPHLVLPQDPLNIDGVCILLESDAGVFYRYKTLGYDLWNQEVCAKDLAIVAMKSYMSPAESRGIRGMSGTGKNIATLIEGLSVSFNQNNNYVSNHNDMCITIPVLHSEFMDAGRMSGIESPDIAPSNFFVPEPKAVSPIIIPSRHLGLYICDIVLSYDEIYILSDVLGGFTGPNPEDELPKASPKLDRKETVKSGLSKEESSVSYSSGAPSEVDSPTYSINLSISGIKFILVDPVLGMHLPIAKICVPNVNTTVSELNSILPDDGEERRKKKKKREKGLPRTRDKSLSSDSLAARDDRRERLNSVESADFSAYDSLDVQAVPKGALQVGANLHVWAEYFNNTLNCWEPLIEPYSCYVLYETCKDRGQGVTIRAECPLHINLSGALIDTIEDALQTFSASTSRKKEAGNPTAPDNLSSKSEIKSALKKTAKMDPSADAERSKEVETFKKELISVAGRGDPITVTHEAPLNLSPEDRVAFSFVNLSGQRVRFHQYDNEISTETASLKYLKHGGRTRLQFAASTNVIRNKHIMEVPFDVQQENFGQSKGERSRSSSRLPSLASDLMNAQGGGGRGRRSSTLLDNLNRAANAEGTLATSIGAHGINLQVAGFEWIANLPADELGSRFQRMIPRNPVIQKKISKDWRLENVMQMKLVCMYSTRLTEKTT